MDANDANWRSRLADRAGGILGGIIAIAVFYGIAVHPGVSRFTWANSVRAHYDSSWLVMNEIKEPGDALDPLTWAPSLRPVRTLKFGRPIGTLDSYLVVETRTVVNDDGYTDSWPGYYIFDCEKRLVVDALDDERLRDYENADPEQMRETLRARIADATTQWKSPDDPSIRLRDASICESARS